jgi:hypothetical protein
MKRRLKEQRGPKLRLNEKCLGIARVLPNLHNGRFELMRRMNLEERLFPGFADRNRQEMLLRIEHLHIVGTESIMIRIERIRGLGSGLPVRARLDVVEEGELSPNRPGTWRDF